MTDPFVPPDPNQPPPAPQPSPWPQPAPPPWQQPLPSPTQQSPWPQQPPPWATQTWYGAPPAKTNGLAIASLVTGILALVPIAIGLGITALVQIHKRGEGGRGLAIGGIAASGAWTLAIGVVVTLAVAFGGADDYRLGDLDQVASTTVGTCLDKSPERVTDCSTPHDYEVYATTTLPDPAWPGDDQVNSRADDYCYGLFGSAVGDYYDSDYDYGYFSPTHEQWLAGRHSVVCVITPFFDDKLEKKVVDDTPAS